MATFVSTGVAQKFAAYPGPVRAKLMALRQLVLATARKLGDGATLRESLKWGQPSYQMKGGSTIRMDWNQTRPNQYAMFFHCQTSLVETFRELYPDTFRFEGNRAIIFDLAEQLPVSEVETCVTLALTYHRRKHLPMLGV